MPLTRLSEQIDRFFEPKPMDEDEYLDPADGLYHCKRCHAPRQTRVNYKGRLAAVPIQCQCQAKPAPQEP